MLPAHLRRYVHAQRVFVGLAGLAFGVLVSVFSNYVFERSTSLLPWVAAFALVIGVVGAILSWRQRPPGIEVMIQAPIAVATEREQKAYARRGLSASCRSTRLAAAAKPRSFQRTNGRSVSRNWILRGCS